MKSKNNAILLLIVLLIIFAILNVFLINKILFNKEIYNPQINPEDFVSKIDNKYLTFTPGTKFVYKGKTKEGTERIEVYVTHETKKVMGVDTIVVWDRVWLENELIEDTKDWFAQDKYGNVWYFGEDSREIVNEKIVSIKGSWKQELVVLNPALL